MSKRDNLRKKLSERSKFKKEEKKEDAKPAIVPIIEETKPVKKEELDPLAFITGGGQTAPKKEDDPLAFITGGSQPAPKKEEDPLAMFGIKKEKESKILHY